MAKTGKTEGTEEVKERESAGTKVSAGVAVIRIVLFAGLFLILFFFVNRFFQPEFSRQNSVVKRRNFYSEPKDTIETAILGASISFHSAIPIELYEKYGICAYDFGSSGQPVLASYFWLQEAYRLHGNALKNVMIDVSILRKNEKLEWYQTAIDAMELSPVKVRATYEYSEDINDTITHLFPLFAYHSRWNQLTMIDFDRDGYEAEDYLRGYFFNTSTAYYEEKKYDDMEIPSFYPDYGDETVPFKTESLYYMQKLIEFCKEKGLHLVFYKTPGQGIGLPAHNTVQQLADANGIEFYDFNFEPLLSEVGYIRPTDNVDNGHLNYYGATKFTDWIGRYLTEGGYATDVRGKPGFEHMDEQLARYKARVKVNMYLRDAENPVDYLRATMENDGYSAIISVKGDAASALTDEQREAFSAMGLPKLAKLGPYDSYVAVIDGGRPVVEEVEENAEKKAAAGVVEEEPVDETDYNMIAKWADDPDVTPVETAPDLTMDDVKAAREIRFAEVPEPLGAEGKLSDGTVYTVVSGTVAENDRASIHLEGEQKSLNGDGLNIVVYDTELSGVVDRAIFDTGVSALRVGYDYENNLAEALSAGMTYDELPEKLQKLYLYYLRSDSKRLVMSLRKDLGDDDLLKYLDTMLPQDRYAIFLAANGKAAAGLGDGVRKRLADMGLVKLSEITEDASYIACIMKGEVKLEQSMANRKEIVAEGIIRPESGAKDMITYRLLSGTPEGKSAVAIEIDGEDYVGNNRGIYIIVWDTITGTRVDGIRFDTQGTTMKED